MLDVRASLFNLKCIVLERHAPGGWACFPARGKDSCGVRTEEVYIRESSGCINFSNAQQVPPTLRIL
jgi:hypothetical protein